MTTVETPPRQREAVARVLLGLAAATAGLASMDAIGSLSSSSPDQAMVLAWRAFGLPVFAGIFGLLAWRPRAYPGVFELAIAHKLAMTGYALVNLDALDADVVLLADGILAAVLIAAYFLVGARMRPRHDGASHEV